MDLADGWGREKSQRPGPWPRTGVGAHTSQRPGPWPSIGAQTSQLKSGMGRS